MMSTELTFLQRCGSFVEATEYVDLLQLRDRVDFTARTANQFPTERNIDLASDMAWRYVTEVDRLYKPARDQEEDALADYALRRLEQRRNAVRVYQAPDVEEE